MKARPFAEAQIEFCFGKFRRKLSLHTITLMSNALAWQHIATFSFFFAFPLKSNVLVLISQPFVRSVSLSLSFAQLEIKITLHWSVKLLRRSSPAMLFISNDKSNNSPEPSTIINHCNSDLPTELIIIVGKTIRNGQWMLTFCG